jgi:hypothetical protein
MDVNGQLHNLAWEEPPVPTDQEARLDPRSDLDVMKRKPLALLGVKPGIYVFCFQRSEYRSGR